MTFFYWLARTIGWLPIRLLYPTKFIGCTKFEKKGAIFAMNHLSAMDSILLVTHVRPQLHFMAKSELRKNKILGLIMKWLGAITIRRGKPDMKATRNSLYVLEKGKILAIFPEGTRNKKNESLQVFKNGAAMIALKSQVPLRVFMIWRKAKPFKRNYVYVGEEFTLNEFYDKKITKELLQEATAQIILQFDEVRTRFNEFLKSRGKKQIPIPIAKVADDILEIKDKEQVNG